MNVALRPETLNVISLCTGGAGLDLGIGLAMPAARSVVLVEREAFAVAHLVAAMQEGLLDDAPVWSDVRSFNGRPWRGLVDGLIGGIPCQPHSLAGKRLGEDDERDLWSDARRIIVQSGAWFVVIENVRGMLSSGGAERVWRDFRRMGFDVEGGLFTAAEVGASHERERIIILAVADAGRTRGEAWFSRSIRPGEEGLAGQPLDSGDALADASIARGRRISIQPRRQVEAGANAHGGGSELVDAIGGGYDRIEEDAIRGSIERTASEWSGGDGFPCLYPPGPADLDSWRAVLAHSPELEPAVRRMADGVAARLDLAGPHAARVERLRMLGNGVVSLQAAYALRTLATRLAARGSAGATRLVRMMEVAA